MPRRFRINWPLLIVVFGFLLIVGLYIAWPVLAQTPDSGIEKGFSFDPSPMDKVRRRGTSTVTSLWFFVFGSTIGSFLNVVAYRMPMGLTFVSKPSRCQYCETPILFRHNVPILGWIALRGRCHSCRLPISPRYLMVELMMGVMYLTVFLACIASGGWNLPVREPNSRIGVMWNLFTPQWDLIGFFALHAFLLGVLATIALIKFDRLRVPIRLVLFSGTIAVVARLIWPFLGLPPAPTFGESVPPLMANAVRVCIDLGVGLVAGSLLQAVVSRARRAGRHVPCGAIAVLSLVAVYLGWQACVPTLIIGGVVHLGVTLLGRSRGVSTTNWWGLSLLVGTWLTLCFWRQLPQVWLPGAETPLPWQVAGLLFGFAIAFVAESLSIANVDPDPDPATEPDRDSTLRTNS